MTNLLDYIIITALAATPISLLLMNYLNKLLSPHDPRLGSTTTIVTNLIGTLTQEHLIVRSIVFDKFKITCPDEGDMLILYNHEEEHEIRIDKHTLQNEETVSLMAQTMALCHYNYDKIKTVEEVITNFFKSTGFKPKAIQDQFQQLETIPSAPDKKISTIVSRNTETKEIFSFSKGNAYDLLKKCSRVIHNNQKIELTQRELRQIRKRIDKLNKNGQKVIAFAYKPLPLKRLAHYSESFAENDMVFLGMIGLTHPLNKKVEENTELINNAGIKTYILTHEKERKAVAIGKILRIVNPQYFEAISGPYLDQLPDQKLSKMLQNRDKDFVFTDLQPEQKTRIMEILRKNGENVSIAKGKNAINHIVHGIKKGRIINKNYRKFATHIISCKIAELLLITAAFITGAPVPFTIASIIILDLTINLFLELTLQADQTAVKVMSKKYHPSNTTFFRRRNFIPGLYKGMVIGTIISIIYFFSLFRDGFTLGRTINDQAHYKAITLAFALLALIQILSTFYLRTKKRSLLQTRPWRNTYLIPVSILSLLILYILYHFQLLNFTEIRGFDWQIIAFLLIVFVIFEEMRRYLIRNT